MAFKFVIFSCLVAFVHGGAIPAAVAAAPVVAAEPLIAAPVAARLEEVDALPQYRFGYEVADTLTGDFKSQTEERNGDLVQGSYSFIEADGTRRVVDYAADSINGFNAVVRKEPLVAAAPAVIAEPAVVPARIAAAPVVAEPAVVPARIAAAPVVPARIAAAPVVPARYAAAPVVPARIAAAPVVAPARYTAAYTAPLAYAAPVAKFAAYTAPVARFASPYAYAPASPVVAV